jgi:hypothetical protein
MSEINLNIEDGIAIGRAKGCEVIQSAPNLLLLDFDTAEALERFDRLRGSFFRLFPADEVVEWPSKSGKPHHRHVMVKLSAPIEDAALRVALQAALGSDPKREIFSVLRLLQGTKEPSLLFKPQEGK